MKKLSFTHVSFDLQLFVCIRSGYFNGLVQNHFHEAYLQGDIPVMKLVDVDPAVIACVLYYIYTNNAQVLHKLSCTS